MDNQQRFLENTYKTSNAIFSKESKKNRISFAWLPMGTSCVLLPILMIVAGDGLGLDGVDGGVAENLFVSIALFLIPVGVMISLICSLFMFISGEVNKKRESVILFISCLLFPIYFIFCLAITDFHISFEDRVNGISPNTSPLWHSSIKD